MPHSDPAASEPKARAHYAPGDTVPYRELATIRSETLPLPAPDAWTHLQFRRFAACPICNVHLHTFARRHHELIAAGICEVAVFHSPVEAMVPHQGALPFATVADPGRELFEEFGVQTSIRSLLHPKVWTAPLRPSSYAAVARQLRAGNKSFGGRSESRTGLPADFFLGPDGRVLAAKYGRHASDHWSIDEVLALANTPPRSHR